MKPFAKLIAIFVLALVFDGSVRADKPKPKAEHKIEIPIPIGRDVIGDRKSVV